MVPVRGNNARRLIGRPYLGARPSGRNIFPTQFLSPATKSLNRFNRPLLIVLTAIVLLIVSTLARIRKL
jgi:hypothetical protein